MDSRDYTTSECRMGTLRHLSNGRAAHRRRSASMRTWASFGATRSSRTAYSRAWEFFPASIVYSAVGERERRLDPNAAHRIGEERRNHLQACHGIRSAQSIQRHLPRHRARIGQAARCRASFRRHAVRRHARVRAGPDDGWNRSVGHKAFELLPRASFSRSSRRTRLRSQLDFAYSSVTPSMSNPRRAPIRSG